MGEDTMTHSRRHLLMAGVIGLATATASAAYGQSKNDPGVSDTEIKIGNIMPYSGPLSAYSIIGKRKQHTLPKLMRTAASMGAGSTLSAMMTGSTQLKQSNRHASLLKATISYLSSRALGHLRMLLYRNT
jgi:hypothetical protein